MLSPSDPRNQFRWKVDNSTVGSISSLGDFTALSPGKVTVSASDVSLEQNEASTRVNVVEPTSLGVTVHPRFLDEYPSYMRNSLFAVGWMRLYIALSVCTQRIHPFAV